MNRFIVGIDHGTTGHICLLDRETDEILLSTMPRRKQRLSYRLKHMAADIAAKDYDIVEMMELMHSAVQHSNGDCCAIMEDPFSRFSKKSTAAVISSLFRSQALWEAACAVNDVTLYRVHPSTWKSKCGCYKKPKEHTLVVASELRPNDVFPTVDAADAFLIARVLADNWELWI